jgi:superfamily II DNA or RNA helicase
MVNENTIAPTSAIHSVLQVDGIIKPTLERLGIVTVGQLADLDVRDLRRVRGVGEKKLVVLSELVEKAKNMLDAGTDPSGGSVGGLTSAADSPSELRPPIVDLVFVPSMLKNSLLKLRVRTVQSLLSLHRQDLEFRYGWGHGKLELLAALQTLYDKYASRREKIDETLPLSEIVPECLLPREDGIGDALLRDVVAPAFNFRFVSDTRAIDFRALQGLLRLLVHTPEENKKHVTTVLGIDTRRSALLRAAVDACHSDQAIGRVPLVFVPGILQRIFRENQITFIRDLLVNAPLHAFGEGGRKSRVFEALQSFCCRFVVHGEEIVAASTVGEVMDPELIPDSRLSAMRIDDFVKTASVGEKTSDEVEELRTLIRLLVTQRPAGSWMSDRPLSFLFHFSNAGMNWRDVPIRIPGRAITLLDACKVETLDEVDQLAVIGRVVCPNTKTTLVALEESNFRSRSMNAIRNELYSLAFLGLDEYRFGRMGRPESCAELVVCISDDVGDREGEVLRRRMAGETLEEVSTHLGITRERVRQIENTTMEKCRPFREVARELFAPLADELNRQLLIPIPEALAIVSAEAEWQIACLAAIAETPCHLLVARNVYSNLSASNIESLRLLLSHLIRQERFRIDSTGKVSVRALINAALESNARLANACGEFVSERDLVLTAQETIQLLGTEWLIPHIRFQLVNAGVNGLAFDEIDTFGLVSNFDDLKSLIASDADVLPGDRLRRPGITYTRTDEVVEIVRQAAAPISLEAITRALRGHWLQPQLVRCLSDRFETIQHGVGIYIHMEQLSLSRADVKKIGEWGASLLAGEKGPVQSDVLFELYSSIGSDHPLANKFQLASIIGKHPDVRRVSVSSLGHRNSLEEQTLALAFTNPDIAAEWHPDRNGTDTPETVRPASNKTFWWRCAKGHEFQASAAARTRNGQGCPGCIDRWTVEKIRQFVKSLQPHLAVLTPAELYVIFQQSGLLQTGGAARGFVKALTTGRFPRKELEKFLEREESLVDEFLDDSKFDFDRQSIDEDEEVLPASTNETVEVAAVEGSIQEEPERLPEVRTKGALSALANSVVASTDGEAAEFLLASAKGKLWSHAYVDEQGAVAQAKEFVGSTYATSVKAEFLKEYEAACSLAIPSGYSFEIDGRLTPPNLMQKLVAVRVRDLRRFGNWSGTGAGKTLSAILATRVVDAGLTVVCCPNSVVGDETDGWAHEILSVYPDSDVCIKTWQPAWNKHSQHRYLVLNYEQFQQPDSEAALMQFLAGNRVDFIVVDEVHFAKQRHADEMSRRKRLVMALICGAGAANPELCVLGMSATPVINNLQEGRSLVELITGVEHEDLSVKPSVPNCMKLHQKLVTLGTRWRPNYAASLETQLVDVDCTEFLPEIRQLGKDHSPLEMERILTRVRLPSILSHLSPGKPTLIYTHYVQEIDRMLYDAIAARGFRVGFFTGDLKDGLDAFREGRLDVLIGSSAVGTGVDGLQKVCSQLIINALPWTNAEYEQLIGRIWRQGQSETQVKVVIPVTFAEINGTRWSYCDTKLRRIQYKKSIADAAVDGVVPEGNLRSPAQAQRDMLLWLERLESGRSSVHSQ